MLKKLFGVAVAAGVTAVGVKVVKDILQADEEEKNIINLEQVQPEQQPEEAEEKPEE